jgi:hypothetical protein
MGSELNTAADFAHLDGAILALPSGMHVHSPGRLGISSEGVPYVDVRLSREEAVRLARWGAAITESQLDHIRAHLAQLLENYPNPERYINQPPCITGEKEN